MLYYVLREINMKKIILILIILVLSGCTMVEYGYTGNETYIYDYANLPLFSSPGEIMIWVYNNIKNKPDTPPNYKNDDWKCPDQTLLEGCGDCEDQCILIAFLLHKYLNIECSIVLMKNINTDKGHCAYRYDGYLMDYNRPRLLNGLNDPILIECYYIFDEISLDEAIEISKNSSTK